MKSAIIFPLIIIFALASANYTLFSEYNPVMTDSSGNCIVDSKKIESNGVYYQYLDRHMMFCSENCKTEFTNEPAGYLGDVLHCPVCTEDDAKKSIYIVHSEVKYYFCGNGCKRKFEKDADKYLKNYGK